MGSKDFGGKVGFQVGFGGKSGIWGKSWRESGIRVDLGEEVSAAVGGRKTHFTRRKALRNRIFSQSWLLNPKKNAPAAQKSIRIFSRLRRIFLKCQTNTVITT